MNRLFVLLSLCFALLAPAAVGQNYTIVDLGVLPGGTFSQGQGVNQSGQVTGGSTSGTSLNTHAFLFSNGTMSDLGLLPGDNFSQGYGINQSGQVTGLSANTSGPTHAFLYSNGTMSELGTLPGGANRVAAIFMRSCSATARYWTWARCPAALSAKDRGLISQAK
jgi:probable HAF family extracellular repeat protein